jgi:hypothetical protein
MGDMAKWSYTLTATLDRPVEEADAYPLGQRVATERLLSVVAHDTRFGIRVLSDAADALDGLTAARAGFVEVLAKAGYSVTAWEAVEALSVAELERRAAASTLPELIQAPEFAELAGVRKQRIYELETERAKAASEGRSHHFPAPLVPGWWVKAGAELWASTRRRKPGRPPRQTD